MGNTGSNIPFQDIAKIINQNPNLSNLDICISPEIAFDKVIAKNKNSASNTRMVFSKLVYQGMQGIDVAMKMFVSMDRDYTEKIQSILDTHSKLGEILADYSIEETALRYEIGVYENSVNKMLERHYTPCLIPFIAKGTCNIREIASKLGVSVNKLLEGTMIHLIVSNLPTYNSKIEHAKVEMNLNYERMQKIKEDIKFAENSLARTDFTSNVNVEGAQLVLQEYMDNYTMYENAYLSHRKTWEKYTKLQRENTILKNNLQEHIRLHILITGKPDNPITMGDFITFVIDTNDNHILLPVLFLCLYTIGVFRELGINHHDLHMGNILVEERPGSKFVLCTSNSDMYYIETDYVPYVFDWDRAYDSSQGRNLTLESYEKYGNSNNFKPTYDIVKFLCYISNVCKYMNNKNLCKQIAYPNTKNISDDRCFDIRNQVNSSKTESIPAILQKKVFSQFKIPTQKVNPDNLYCFPSVDRNMFL